MGDELKEIDFTAERVADVRAAVRALMDREQLTLAKVAREANMGDSTLPAFMNDSYVGNKAAQALKLQRWITSRLASASVQAQSLKGPGYVKTRSSEQFAALLEHAHYTPDFAVLVGVPGVGKTLTATTYVSNVHNAYMVTCQPTSTTASGVVAELSIALGIGTQVGFGNASFLTRQINNKLRNTTSLIIIDEAQHLKAPALDQLRFFHDISGCGIALMGNHSIFRRMEGGTRSADYAQLYSRVGMRIDKKKTHSDDIEALLDAWEITDPKVRRVARAVARKPGALRTMTKVLRQAHLRARNEDGQVTEAQMLAAARQLGDEKPLELDA